jgi:hypothetical protein
VRRTENDIWDEEYGSRNVVLVASESKILVHAFDLRVADIRTVNMGEEVENSHNGDQANIDLQIGKYGALNTVTVRRTLRSTFLHGSPSYLAKIS